MDFPIVLPPVYLEKAHKLGIFAHDIDEFFVRGSGKGGQKVNKTSSTVMLKYRPLGIEIRCQKHREQSKNRLSAYKLLINKVEERILGRESAAAKEKFKLKKQKQRRSRKAKEKMLKAKKLRSELKENRKNMGSF